MYRAIRHLFEKFASAATQASGSVWAFTAAFLLIVGWGVTGPLFHYSEVWQLVINTATTIITFLMVFLIQHAQNKDTRAVHLKLNELIAASEGGSNRLIDVEDLTEEELEHLYHRYQALAKHAKNLAQGKKMSIDEEADFKEELRKKHFKKV